MQLYEIENAVTLFYEMLRHHPELCPHDWEWIMQEKDGTKHYRCKICEKEKIEQPK